MGRVKTKGTYVAVLVVSNRNSSVIFGHSGKGFHNIIVGFDTDIMPGLEVLEVEHPPSCISTVERRAAEVHRKATFLRGITDNNRAYTPGASGTPWLSAIESASGSESS